MEYDSVLYCRDIDCCECKHHKTLYYYDPILGDAVAVKDVICLKGHERTTYNVNWDKIGHFRCNHFERKLYWRIIRYIKHNIMKWR